jgi:hypothetical protein
MILKTTGWRAAVSEVKTDALLILSDLRRAAGTSTG